MTLPTILLTGSSRGIGAAAASALRARGARVVGHASRTADADTLAADLSDSAAPRALWDAALGRAGGTIDVLVNNAGVFDANPIARDDDEWLAKWEHDMAVNLTSTAQLSRLAVRHWQARGCGGRIVHVASRAGHRGDSPEHWHYAAAKGGMLALHKTIARGYAGQGILSFAVTPGFTDTGFDVCH